MFRIKREVRTVARVVTSVATATGLFAFLVLPMAAQEDWAVHRDAELGLELRYPSSYLLSQSPSLLQAAHRAAEQEVGEQLAQQSEFRFFLFIYPPGSRQFNPNLNLTLEQVPEGAGEVTNEDYLWANVTTMRRTGIDIPDQPAPVSIVIHGREFYRVDGTMIDNGSLIRSRAYYHYDPRTRRGYGFSLTDIAAEAERHFPLMDAVMETVKIDAAGGSVDSQPVEPPQPASNDSSEAIGSTPG